MDTDFLSCKKVHFIGIGGIGVSAVARLFLTQGAEVSGSDTADFPDRPEMEQSGMKIAIGHRAENIPPDVQAIVYSGAVPETNPEFVAAKGRGVPVLEYFEALGAIMHGRYGIAVSGTNGKTSTTALLGKILERAGLDPLVIVGGKVPGWNKNLRLPVNGLPSISQTPQGETSKEIQMSDGVFLVEGDEYRRHMLQLSPQVISLTNIEADHLDYYKDLAEIKETFLKYIKKIPEKGTLTYNNDDGNVRDIVEEAQKTNTCRKISYAIDTDADLRASNLMYGEETRMFRVSWQKEDIGIFSFPFPGRFNVYNALAAIAPALALGVPIDAIRAATAEFTGTWRRFERIGKVHGKVVISDYAHHPTAVSGTIRATAELYPGKKILAVFQPHQKDRTRKMLHEFADSFHGADTVILSEIYDVAGRDEKSAPISSQNLLDEMKKDPKNPPTGFAHNIDQTEQRIRDIMDSFDIILIMGAGDIHKLAEKLVGK